MKIETVLIKIKINGHWERYFLAPSSVNFTIDCPSPVDSLMLSRTVEQYVTVSGVLIEQPDFTPEWIPESKPELEPELSQLEYLINKHQVIKND